MPPPQVPQVFNRQNILNDYQVMDDLETIQFYVADGNGGYGSPITIPNCLRRERRIHVQRGNDVVEVDGMTWHLWYANIPVMTPTFVPNYSDRIVATELDGTTTTWIITDAINIATLTTRYQVTTLLSQVNQ